MEDGSNEEIEEADSANPLAVEMKLTFLSHFLSFLSHFLPCFESKPSIRYHSFSHISSVSGNKAVNAITSDGKDLPTGWNEHIVSWLWRSETCKPLCGFSGAEHRRAKHTAHLRCRSFPNLIIEPAAPRKPKAFACLLFARSSALLIPPLSSCRPTAYRHVTGSEEWNLDIIVDSVERSHLR